MLVETLQFPEPFSLCNKRLWANDKDGLDVHARAQLPDDEGRLDGLADAHLISDEQARPIRADEFQYRAVLVGHELDAAGPKREQASRRGGEDLQGCEMGT